MTLTDRCISANDKLVGLIARKTAMEEQLSTGKLRMAELADRKAHLLKCLAVLDALIQAISSKGLGRIESVVTNGLQLVFGPNLSCVIEKTEGKRGVTYAVKVKNGEVVADPMEAFGGGVVNVTAFLLRVLLLHRFKLARLLVLDESFNNVSTADGNLSRVSTLLRTLADDYGFHILSVTHQNELARAAHAAYEVSSTGAFTLRQLGAGELG